MKSRESLLRRLLVRLLLVLGRSLAAAAAAAEALVHGDNGQVVGTTKAFETLHAAKNGDMASANRNERIIMVMTRA